MTEDRKIESPNVKINFEEIQELRQEIEKLREQNKELKKALISSLDARIYSLLGLCGFHRKDTTETSEE